MYVCLPLLRSPSVQNSTTPFLSSLSPPFCLFRQQYRGAYRMRIYNRPEMSGHMMEFMDDCPNVYERFRHRDIFSSNVMEGYWVFYEHPNYRGRQYFLRPGEYNKHSDWGSMSSTSGSVRRVIELKQTNQ